MAGSNESMKNKAMAAYLKKNNVTRKTGTHCPHGCGREISVVNVSGLLNHMNACKGKR